MPAPEMTTTEAAYVLGISPQRVRDLAAHGVLPARRTPAGWLIETGAVERRAVASRPGRPWTAATAWAVIALVEGDASRIDDRRLRHRARKFLVEAPDPRRDSPWWVRHLARRARTYRMWIHPGALDHAAGDPAISIGGADAFARLGGDTLAHRYTDLYVAEDLYGEVVSRWALRVDHDTPNLRIRVVPRDVPEEMAPTPGAVASPAAGAADLLDAAATRERHAAIEALGQLYDACR